MQPDSPLLHPGILIPNDGVIHIGLVTEMRANNETAAFRFWHVLAIYIAISKVSSNSFRCSLSSILTGYSTLSNLVEIIKDMRRLINAVSFLANGCIRGS